MKNVYTFINNFYVFIYLFICRKDKNWSLPKKKARRKHPMHPFLHMWLKKHNVIAMSKTFRSCKCHLRIPGRKCFQRLNLQLVSINIIYTPSDWITTKMIVIPKYSGFILERKSWELLYHISLIILLQK